MPIDVKKRKWPRWRPWFDMDRVEIVVPKANGGDIFLPGIHIIHLSIIFYHISHFAAYRSKFSDPFSGKNIP